MRQRQFSAGRSGASVLGCAFILGLVACAGETTTDADFATAVRDSSAGSGAAANDAALSAVSSCDVLLAELQSDLIEQVHERAAQVRDAAQYYYGGGVFIDDVVPTLGTSVPVASAPVFSPISSSSAPTAAAPASAFSGFSETTVQVPGVDEGDFVKAEGDRLYLLHGDSLYVLDAQSATATEVVSSIVIEGSPTDLLVRDGQVLVASNVYGPLPGQDYNYYNPYYYPNFAKLTVLDASGDSIGVVRESFLEGYYGGSRRHDSVVRALVQETSKVQLDYPTVSYFDIFGRPRSQAEIDLQVDLWVLLSLESIEESEVEDYLPSAFERVDGELVQQPSRCADYLLPGPGLLTRGATSVVSLDLDAALEPLGKATLLGYAEGVYANDDVLLLRQTDYGDYTLPIPEVKTNIHRFELDGTATTYTASGTVSGYVPSSFGVDEVDGVIRAVTSEDRYTIESVEGGEIINYVGSVNRVVTLGTAPDGALVELGSSPEFGPEGSAYQSRFVGDYAYALTYGEVGVLYVVDVSDPSSPLPAGQTAASGYTSMLLPLPNDRLLGIGETVDASGIFLGSGLRLFDVSDPTAPSIASEFVFSEPGYSDASYDARAISFHPTRSLLSLPYQSYNTGRTTLEVIHVSSSVGLDHVASIAPASHEPTLLECLTLLGYPTDPEFLALLEQNPDLAASLMSECSYYFMPSARRGLFRGDDLFLIHTLGVDAYSVYGLTDPPIGEVDLPLSYPYYYYRGPIGPVPVASAPVPASEGEAAPEAEEAIPGE